MKLNGLPAPNHGGGGGRQGTLLLFVAAATFAVLLSSSSFAISAEAQTTSVDVTITSPGEPTKLGVSRGATNTDVILSWRPPADDGGSSVTHYGIQYATNSKFIKNVWTDQTQPIQGSPRTVSHTVSGLEPDTRYYFKINAVNGAGESPWTDPVRIATRPVVTVAPVADNIIEGDPAKFRVSLSPAPDDDTQVTVKVRTSGGVDATGGHHTVTVPAGASSAVLDVATTLGEGPNTGGKIDANVKRQAGYAPGNPNSASVHVTDVQVQVVEPEPPKSLPVHSGNLAIVLNPTSLNVPEGGSASYTVKLNHQPVDDRVTLRVALVGDGNSRDTDLQQVTDLGSQNILTFTTTNWDVAQTVTFSAREDADMAAGTADVSHTVWPQRSSDEWDAVSGATLTLTEVDNDVPTAGATVTAADNLTVTEGDTTATASYTVVLDTDPGGNVEIDIAATNSKVTVSPSSLTFTTSDWSTAQTVTITAADDDDASDETDTITHMIDAANTDDDDYDSVTINSVTVSVTDDDEVGVTVTADASWIEQRNSIISTNTLNSVHFADANNGWAVGNHGTIRHTTDGGSNWAAQQTSDTLPVNYTTQDLNSVHFADANNGWAVGLSGTILHTDDGGTSWAAQTNSVTKTLYSVYFHDANNGWAVGRDGTILHTDDGGSDWTAQTDTDIPDEHLNSVYFHDANNGWAVGRDGTIIRTDDGGSDWTDETAPAITNVDLESVHFADANNGWAVGRDGTIIRTDDGGSDWTDETSSITWINLTSNISTRNLNSVYFSDANNGWAVGRSGHILNSALTVTEGSAATVSYTVVLDTKPGSDVNINIAKSNSKVNLDETRLTFTTSDWNTAKTVTIRAVDDDNVSDDATTITHTIDADNTDDAYDDVTINSVRVGVTDDDTPSMLFSATSLTTFEPWMDGPFRVVNEGPPKVLEWLPGAQRQWQHGLYEMHLSNPPQSFVTIQLTSNMPDHVRVDTDGNPRNGYQDTITFTPDNWDCWQRLGATEPERQMVSIGDSNCIGHMVDVIAFYDVDHDDEQVTITHTVVISHTDPDFYNMTIPDVSVRVYDADQYGATDTLPPPP